MKKKSQFEDNDLRDSAAHEAGHILGILAMSKIKNCLKPGLKTISVKNQEQSERIIEKQHGADFLEKNLPGAGVGCILKPNQKRSSTKAFNFIFLSAILGRMGISGTLFLYTHTEQKPEIGKIVWQTKTDRGEGEKLIKDLSKFTGFERTELLKMINQNGINILKKNEILFNKLTEAIIQSNFDLPNKPIMVLVKQYGFVMPESIQQDIDKLDATRIARLILSS